MKRREFLKRTAPILAAPVLINGMRVRALASGHGPGAAGLLAADGRVLVVIQLQGGNDGLNTVIPVDDDKYHEYRPTVKIEKADALPLDGVPLLRMHPKMTGMQRMFNDGRLAIVQNVGYGRAGMSHFVETEMWQTGTGLGSGNAVTTGWVGRYLRREFPEFPTVLPDDPPAVEIGRATSSMFTIVGTSISMSLTDPAEFYALVKGVPSGKEDPAADTPAGHEKGFVDIIDQQSHAYADAIRAAAAKAANLVAYPKDNELGESLAIIARLIAGGLSTRVYKVTLGGFDTHAFQTLHHGELMSTLSDAVAAFQDDLVALRVDSRVVGMTYSEFGRRAYDNGSGTDHGAAAPHFVFGTPVVGGTVYGGLPMLNELDASGSLKHTIDFHCYYASVLAPLFNVSAAAIDEILPAAPCARADYLPIIRAAASGVRAETHALDGYAVSAVPNAASVGTTVVITLPRAGHVRVRLIDAAGHEARTLFSGQAEAGRTRLPADLSGLPAGAYIVVMETDAGRTTTRLNVVR